MGGSGSSPSKEQKVLSVRDNNSVKVTLDDLFYTTYQGTGGNYIINNMSTTPVTINDGNVTKTLGTGTFTSSSQGLPGFKWVTVTGPGYYQPAIIQDAVYTFPADNSQAFALLPNNQASSTIQNVKPSSVPIAPIVMPIILNTTAGTKGLAFAWFWWLLLIIIIILLIIWAVKPRYLKQSIKF